MKSDIITKFLILTFFIMLIGSSNQVLSQQKGEFDINYKYDGGEIMLACYVPPNYSASKSYHLIIALHPAGTPAQMMRMMLMPIVSTMDAILVCPDNVDYENAGVMEGMDFAKANYNINPSTPVMTGYSAGGAPTFDLGLQHNDKFKGIIGIAPAVGSLSQHQLSVVSKFPIGIIVGDQDGFKGNLDQIVDAINQNNGLLKYIVRAGVGHTGPYFYGPDFAKDWMECYNFIQTAKPKPGKVALSEPANMAKKVELPVTLKWNPVDGATSYKVELSLYGSFSEILEFANVTKTEYQPSLKVKNGSKHFWRVVAINEAGEGILSETWYFTTVALAPTEAPLQFKPQNNTTNVKKADLQLQWRPVQGIPDYKLQVFEGDAETPFIDEELKYTTGVLMSYPLTGLKYETTYKWHVRCFNEGGDGPWFETWSFTTEADMTSVDDNNGSDFTVSAAPNVILENGLLNIHIPTDGNLKVRLITTEGVIASEIFDGQAAAGNHSIQFDTKNLNSGVYFVNAAYSNKAKTIKVVVLK